MFSQNTIIHTFGHQGLKIRKHVVPRGKSYASNVKQIIHTAVSAQASSTSEYFSVIFPPNKIFSRNVSENIQASWGETEILLERRTLPSVTSNSFSNTESNVL